MVKMNVMVKMALLAIQDVLAINALWAIMALLAFLTTWSCLIHIKGVQKITSFLKFCFADISASVY